MQLVLCARMIVLYYWHYFMAYLLVILVLHTDFYLEAYLLLLTRLRRCVKQKYLAIAFYITC